jgi:hypothetical protein
VIAQFHTQFECSIIPVKDGKIIILILIDPSDGRNGSDGRHPSSRTSWIEP